MTQLSPRLQKKNSGQALIEYALAIFMIIAVSGVINMGVKKGIGKIWLQMAKDIAPGCPGCSPPQQMQ